jgi:hypothetical protein
LFGSFADYFRAMQQRGIVRYMDPELAARAFHGMFFNYFNVEEMLARKCYKPTDRARVVKEFVTIFARGTEKR